MMGDLYLGWIGVSQGGRGRRGRKEEGRWCIYLALLNEDICVSHFGITFVLVLSEWY